jgi:hypothetical protein
MYWTDGSWDSGIYGRHYRTTLKQAMADARSRAGRGVNEIRGTVYVRTDSCGCSNRILAGWEWDWERSSRLTRMTGNALQYHIKMDEELQAYEQQGVCHE